MSTSTCAVLYVSVNSGRAFCHTTDYTVTQSTSDILVVVVTTPIMHTLHTPLRESEREGAIYWTYVTHTDHPPTHTAETPHVRYLSHGRVSHRIKSHIKSTDSCLLRKRFSLTIHSSGQRSHGSEGAVTGQQRLRRRPPRWGRRRREMARTPPPAPSTERER